MNPKPLLGLAALVLAACAAPPNPNATPTPPTSGLEGSPTSSPSAFPTTPTPVPTQSASAIAFFDLQHGLLVGSTADGKGAVWRTADAGSSWTESTLDTVQLALVAVAGDSLAWVSPRCVSEPIAANGCSLFTSGDGGRSWTKVSDGQFDAVSFVDAEHGWAVATEGPNPGGGQVVGGITATSDGGVTWSQLPASPCASIGWPVALSFVDRLHGWVGCGGMGGAGQEPKGIAATSDGGATWTDLARATPPGAGYPPSLGTIFMSDYLAGISMRPSGVGLAWEKNGATLRTTDRGRTWLTMPTGGAAGAGAIPESGWAITDRDWLVLMWEGDLQTTVLWVTSNGGRTWQAGSRVPPGA